MRAELDGGQRRAQRVEGHVLAGHREPQRQLVVAEPGPHAGARAVRA